LSKVKNASRSDNHREPKSDKAINGADSEAADGKLDELIKPHILNS
jgi:hypothetical protein